MELGQLAQSVEPHRIEPLEDVAVLAVHRRAAVFLHEVQDVLEARVDPLLARRAIAPRRNRLQRVVD